MRKLFIALMLLGFTIAASSGAAEVTTNALVWCGLDYSKVKMIGTMDFRQPEQIFPGMLVAWNGLFMKEMLPKLESMTKPVLSDMKAVADRNEKADEKQIEREDGTSDEKVKVSHITEADIAEIVRSYELKNNKGVGLVFIMDRLVKAQAKGCLYVVFFDIESRKVLYSERVVAAADGVGFRNYWFSPVKSAVNQVPKMYKQIKAKK